MAQVFTPPRRWPEVGAQIKRARKQTGLSQERFAPRIGTTRRHLIKLENGEHRPGPALQGAIEQETGVKLDIPREDDEEEPSLGDILNFAIAEFKRKRVNA